MYIDPVLWNQSNQITSDVMDIFTENQQITRAEFVGSPMMVSELDTLHYNQVAGKQMTAYFRVTMPFTATMSTAMPRRSTTCRTANRPRSQVLGVIESGDCSFYIEDKQVITIVYRGGPRLEHLSDGQDSARSGAFPQGFQVGGSAAPDAGRRFRPQDTSVAARGQSRCCPIRIFRC
ncbi:MAG: hypothetical protein ACLUNS_00145 [Alistipes shahii]